MAQTIPVHRLRGFVQALCAGVATPVATEEPEIVTPSVIAPEVIGKPSCKACGIVFDDFTAQRAHFKSKSHLDAVRGGDDGKATADTDACVPGYDISSHYLHYDDVRLVLQCSAASKDAEAVVDSAGSGSTSEDSSCDSDGDEAVVTPNGPKVTLHCNDIAKSFTVRGRVCARARGYD